MATAANHCAKKLGFGRLTDMRVAERLGWAVEGATRLCFVLHREQEIGTAARREGPRRRGAAKAGLGVLMSERGLLV